MTCTYCGAKDATADSDYCESCQKSIQEAMRQVLAGLADMIRADREQEAKEQKVA